MGKRCNLVHLMGRKVYVTRAAVRVTDHAAEPSCHWESCSRKGRTGWVVGVRWLQRGTSEAIQGGDFCRTWVEHGKRFQVLLVSFWPTEDPIKVPLDGYEDFNPRIHPEPWPSAGVMGGDRERDREWKQIAVRDVPRDKRGRFI